MFCEAAQTQCQPKFVLVILLSLGLKLGFELFKLCSKNLPTSFHQNLLAKLNSIDIYIYFFLLTLTSFDKVFSSWLVA